MRGSRNRQWISAALACLLFVAGCGTLQMDPVAEDKRAVRPASDTTKTVTVKDGMVWYNASPPTRGVRFPPGTYVLEAEDDDYWYLRSPAPLEFKVLRNGEATFAGNVPGGIMIGKSLLRIVPAAAYADGDGSTKVMTWKLGNNFLRLEGSAWRKSF